MLINPTFSVLTAISSPGPMLGRRLPEGNNLELLLNRFTQISFEYIHTEQDNIYVVNTVAQLWSVNIYVWSVKICRLQTHRIGLWGNLDFPEIHSTICFHGTKTSFFLYLDQLFSLSHLQTVVWYFQFYHSYHVRCVRHVVKTMVKFCLLLLVFKSGAIQHFLGEKNMRLCSYGHSKKTYIFILVWEI